MKKLILSFGVLLLLAPSLRAAETTLEGYFQGENLFVKNPYAADGTSYCVSKVTVNGQDSKSQLNSSAFEIALDKLGLNSGDAVTLVITHEDGCKPEVVNIEAMMARSTFVISAISVNDQGQLKWSTIEEQGRLPYFVQQYRWGKWVTLGRTEGKGLSSRNDYEFDLNASSLIKPHEGVNKYRVKQIDFHNRERFSLETNFTNEMPPITITSSTRVSDKYTFSEPTSYQLINEQGDMVREGFGPECNVSGLEKGKYFLNFDSKTETVRVK